MQRGSMVMRWFEKKLSLTILVLISILLVRCGQTKTKESYLFETLGANQTGLHFVNELTPSEQFNMFHYMYFYNGAGIGAGDFNNDGLIDLFFASNQGDNKLFLNEGKLHFKDASVKAGIPTNGGWSTGVSVVDINNDGLLDIYVCKVGNYEVLKGKNQFLICQGIKDGVPFYADEAEKFGLDFSGFCTQAVFFDYDLDGDLDMFLLNHAIHQNGSFAPRANFLGTYDIVSGDRFYRNDGIKFTDVTKESKINSSAIGYGLGIAVSDIDLDGWPDIYIGNDFHENDYLYINQQNGTFTEENTKHLMHSSQFSMGVDVADVTNDGYPEIISMDMLPSDPNILKRSVVDNDYDIFYNKISIGYSFQYSRNNLQYNRKNGMFSEAGTYSGVDASDWSWAPLWFDFDNDGWKDLFISNGIPKRLNDLDYINFISNEDIQRSLRNKTDDKRNIELVKKFPDTKIPNRFYKNDHNLKFEDISGRIGSQKSTYSNGAIYADLDNDGDLDVVVNNIDEPPLLYRNQTNDAGGNEFFTLKLKGSSQNLNATGAKLVLFAGKEIRVYDKNPVRGFQSSMEIPMHIGLRQTKIDSAYLVWPDNTFQQIQLPIKDRNLLISFQKGLPLFDYSKIVSFRKWETKKMADITSQVGLNYVHRENSFPEFSREPLIPHMVSTEGPALAVGDANGDGLQDVFIGSSKGFHNAIFLQQSTGKFIHSVQPDMITDSMYEDVDACWADVNGDRKMDLVVASGGNEFYGQEKYLMPRVYLNDNARFKKLDSAFSNIYVMASCIKPCDFNKDGNVDLFVGGKVVPWEYGRTPKSYLLQNDGTGKFKDVTDQYAKGLSNAGMINNAVWIDLDKDNDEDLVVCLQWGGIDAYLNNNGRFEKKVLTGLHGWWNFILPVDVNNDGNIDLVAGNLGLNSRLQASEKQPVRLYYDDFDKNGKKEQVLTYYVNGREIPFANKNELDNQMPVLKKKFLYAREFAAATLEQIFTKEKLKEADTLTANYFSNAILINNGHSNFSLKELPWETQLSTYRDAIAVDANDDALPDILLMGNYYQNNIQMGRNDSDFGTILVNKGNNSFQCESLNGIQVKGQVRHIQKLMINNKEHYILAKNSDSTRVITFE